MREANGTTRAIEVGGYFDATDGRIDTFRFENVPQEERQKTEPFRVPRFHRTLSGWVHLIVEAGLVIERDQSIMQAVLSCAFRYKFAP